MKVGKTWFGILLSCSLVQLHSCADGYSSQVSWSSKRRLHEYHSFRNSEIFVFNVMPAAIMTGWLISAEGFDDCKQDIDISVYIQHGGLPVIAPNNESFPEDFNLDRLIIEHFTLNRDNDKFVHKVFHPKPGAWLITAFIDNIDIRIRQKGLAQQCNHYIIIYHYSKFIESVRTLDTSRLIEVEGGTDQWNRFYVGTDIWQYNLEINDCITSTSEPCNVMIFIGGCALPGAAIKICSSFPCNVTVEQPMTDCWHFLQLQSLQNDTFNVTGRIAIDVCPFPLFLPFNISSDDFLQPAPKNFPGKMLNSSNVTNFDSVKQVQPLGRKVSFLLSANFSPESLICHKHSQLGRLLTSDRPFNVVFLHRVHDIPHGNLHFVPFDSPVVQKFYLNEMSDMGGTLIFRLQLLTGKLNETSIRHAVKSCIMPGQVPINANGVNCPDSMTLWVNSSSSGNATLNFPYPQTKIWYLAFQAFCEAPDPSLCTLMEAFVEFELRLAMCASACNDHGNCVEYLSGDFHFGTCVCRSHWRGFGCTDGLKALSFGEQLISVLLLTLSNLAFIASIAVAVHRHFYVEAIVYSFTMFFSTFYHACDSSDELLFCLLRYDVLSFSDFYGSILSFWVTLVALGEFTEYLNTFLLACGALGIAVGVEWDKHSIWAFFIPVVIAGIILVAAWSRRCYSSRNCFPSKRRWLLNLFPGILILVIGMIVFALFETKDNYHYTHSLWHCCTAISILFVLPPKKEIKSVNIKSGITGKRYTLEEEEGNGEDVQETVSTVQEIA